MQLTRPFPKSTMSQGFAENATELYKKQGLVGHSGQDYVVSHGTPVPCAADNSYCYSTLNKDHPDPSKYRAPCFIVEDATGVYEIIYGHSDAIYAVPGRMYHTGDIISTVGNTGPVYVGGKEITTAEKLKGSKAGSHLHFQLRLLKKVQKRTKNKQYIVDGNGILKKNGYYYEIVNYENGTKGCIDPEPFFAAKLTFTRDLYLGMEGEDVRALQKYLNANGFRVAWIGNGAPGRESTYFGNATQKALIAFQKAKGISPAAGYFGSITRKYIGK